MVEKPAHPTLKVPPHNFEAEIAVLGGCLNYLKYIPHVANLLEPSDFYKEAHIYICEAMFELKEKTDFVNVCNWLAQKNLLEKSDRDYIASLMEAVSTGAGYKYHAEIVKDLSRRRKLIEECQEVAEKAFKLTENLDSVLTDHKEGIRKIESNAKEPVTSNKELVQRVYKTIEDKAQSKDHTVGVLTGFDNIDRHAHGLAQSCTYYLGGETGTGKSALALNIGENVARENRGHVLYFTLESTRDALTFRRFARESGISLTRLQIGEIRSGGEWEDLHKACNRIMESLMFILESSKFMTFEAVSGFCESFASDNSLLLVVIDFLQLMSMIGRFDSQHQMYKQIAVRLNYVAKDLKVPIMVLSQLNQEGKLKESRDLQNNADHVWILDRKDKEAEHAKLTATKGKDIGTWSTWLKFDRFIQRFYDCEEQYESPTEVDRGFNG